MKYSRDFFSDKHSNKLYDLIYIDGSHIPEDITFDMENSFKVLRKGGIMWMDDYLGGPAEDNGRIRITMDAFINSHSDEVQIISKGYQLAIKKL